jgi:hypothetical protein
MLYASNASTLSTIPLGADGDVLSVTAGVPAWGSGSGVFIQNQNGSAQTANFHIDGNGTIDGDATVGASLYVSSTSELLGTVSIGSPMDAGTLYISDGSFDAAYVTYSSGSLDLNGANLTTSGDINTSGAFKISGVDAITTERVGNLTSIDNNGGGITNAGAISGGTGITSSGTITLSGLTTAGVVHNDASGVLSTSLLNPAADVTPGGANTFLRTANDGTTVGFAALAVGSTLTGDASNTSLNIDLTHSNTWSGLQNLPASSAQGNNLVSAINAGSLAIGAVHGGTGQTSYSTGDMLYASNASTLSTIPVGSTGDVLHIVGGTPSWAAGTGLFIQNQTESAQTAGFHIDGNGSMDGDATIGSSLYVGGYSDLIGTVSLGSTIDAGSLYINDGFANGGSLTYGSDTFDFNGSDLSTTGNVIGYAVTASGGGLTATNGGLTVTAGGMTTHGYTRINTDDFDGITSIGNTSNDLELHSNALNISSLGEITGASTITASGNINTASGSFQVDAEDAITSARAGNLTALELNSGSITGVHDITSDGVIFSYEQVAARGALTSGETAVQGYLNLWDALVHLTTVTSALQAADRTYTIPDAGADAEFVLNAGNQSIAGTKTFSGTIASTSSAPLHLNAATPVISVKDGETLAIADDNGTPHTLLSLADNGTSGTLTVANFSGALTGSVTGNASTATALQTSRNINGEAFDGTGDITVTAAAGTLTGTTLASNVVTSSLTSVGTIGTGVWNGTEVSVSKGGTGATTAGGALTNLGVQAGTATLVGGTVTVNTGVAITANSIIVVSVATPSGTQGLLSVPPGSLVPGVPGVGSFDINSTDGGDASTVNFIIIH